MNALCYWNCRTLKNPYNTKVYKAGESLPALPVWQKWLTKYTDAKKQAKRSNSMQEKRPDFRCLECNEGTRPLYSQKIVLCEANIKRMNGGKPDKHSCYGTKL
jgi:hypothetical protein